MAFFDIFLYLVVVVAIFMAFMFIRENIIFTHSDVVEFLHSTVRYTVPDDVVVIDNTKDCSKPVKCQINAASLANGCYDCKQLNTECIHFDTNETIEFGDGQQIVLEANTSKNEGYCMSVARSKPALRTCNVWGKWILVNTAPGAYVWICKCVYPQIFDNANILSDCIEQRACEGGKLSNIESGQISELQCDCDVGWVVWLNEERVPQCRYGAFIDGEYYKSTENEYFKILRNAKFMITRLHSDFGMPKVKVINPIFLSIAEFKFPTWNFHRISHKYDTKWLTNKDYPTFWRTHFSSNLANYNVDTTHANYFCMGVPRDLYYPSSIFCKIVIDPISNSEWYTLPWGYFWGTLHEPRGQFHQFASLNNVLVDPNTDIFRGRMYAIFNSNIWWFTPYPNPRVECDHVFDLSRTFPNMFNRIPPITSEQDFIEKSKTIFPACYFYYYEDQGSLNDYVQSSSIPYIPVSVVSASQPNFTGIMIFSTRSKLLTVYKYTEEGFAFSPEHLDRVNEFILRENPTLYGSWDKPFPYLEYKSINYRNNEWKEKIFDEHNQTCHYTTYVYQRYIQLNADLPYYAKWGDPQSKELPVTIYMPEIPWDTKKFELPDDWEGDWMDYKLWYSSCVNPPIPEIEFYDKDKDCNLAKDAVRIDYKQQTSKKGNRKRKAESIAPTLTQQRGEQPLPCKLSKC